MSIQETLKEFDDKYQNTLSVVELDMIKNDLVVSHIRLMEEMLERMTKKIIPQQNAHIETSDWIDIGYNNALGEEIKYLQDTITHLKKEL
jgi:hypothetical protein